MTQAQTKNHLHKFGRLKRLAVILVEHTQPRLCHTDHVHRMVLCYGVMARYFSLPAKQVQAARTGSFASWRSWLTGRCHMLEMQEPRPSPSCGPSLTSQDAVGRHSRASLCFSSFSVDLNCEGVCGFQFRMLCLTWPGGLNLRIRRRIEELDPFKGFPCSEDVSELRVDLNLLGN